MKTATMKPLIHVHVECLTIPAGRAISRAFLQDVQLNVLQGRVWATMSGVLQDYWIDAGQSLVLEGRRLIVIEADKMPSRIELMPIASSFIAPTRHDKLANEISKKSGLDGKLGVQCC